MTAPGIPNDYALSTACFGTRLGSIQDQIFAAVGMGFRRIELGLAECPPTMDGLDESRRETGVTISALVAGCRDPLNGTLAATRLTSPDPKEREHALNSVRRHVRLAHAWGCPTVIVRGSKVHDPKLAKEAKDLEARVERGITSELKDEVCEFVQRVQRAGAKQIEQLCRALHALHQESPDARFALAPAHEIDDLLAFEAMGWVLDDFAGEGVGYWHDVGGTHTRERIGLQGQGAWLDAYGARMYGCHLQDAAQEELEMPIGLGEVDFRLLREYVPRDAERVLEIGAHHGRAEILASVQYLVENGF